MKIERNVFVKDVVVVLFILGLIFIIILPLLGRFREMGVCRIQCASVLNGISKSMVLYANDNRGAYPYVGPKDNIHMTFGMGLYNEPGKLDTYPRWVDPEFNDWEQQATVGASLYLLIKYTDLVPKMFICPSSDDDPIKLEPAMMTRRRIFPDGPPVETYCDLNDFPSMRNLSYSYNDPWKNPIDDSANSGLAVLADKSPAFDTETGIRNLAAGDFPAPQVGDRAMDWCSTKHKSQYGNSLNHNGECQNVGYADTHVKKEETPLVGIEEDNIFTRWHRTGENEQWDIIIGRWDQGHAEDFFDSYLGN